jgi:hypothetical protein
VRISKAEKYLEYLERSFIVRRIFPAGGVHHVCGRAARHLSSLREIHAGTKTSNYLVDIDGTPIVIEVGGPGKGRSQFKEVEYERKVIVQDGEPSPSGSSGVRRVPLHVLGFA